MNTKVRNTRLSLKHKGDPKCLHIIAHWDEYIDGRAMVCNRCDRILRIELQKEELKIN